MTGRPVALIILDGWGVAPPGPGNAVDLARTPVFDALWAANPHTTLAASGLDVGLPAGQIGNSEVGHLNLGAGRVVYQDLTRIDRAVDDGSFATNEVLQRTVSTAVERDCTVHVLGLVSHGGVHSHQRHVEELLRVFVAGGVSRVRAHAITDGRDVLPDSSLHDIPALEAALARLDADARVATVVGRYWAMDRDRRWDRTKRAWDAFVHGVGASAASAAEAVRAEHAAGRTDEFVEPYVLDPEGTIRDGDIVVCANFRPDRMRQLVHALTDETFDGFDRGARPRVDVVCMAEYDAAFGLPVLFPPASVDACLADVLEAAGVGQLHVAETEKYAHVTYFFDGGVERVRAGEVRELAPSPRDVPTYDHKPEMNAVGVADRFVAGFADESVGFAVLNFANPDMVGHTGVIEAAVAACEAVDVQLARVLDAVRARGGVSIVTADHGNAETMLTDAGGPHTAHTTNPVPLVVDSCAGDGGDAVVLRDGGRLADVAPTVLHLLGIDQPVQMTGTPLCEARVQTR